jgi:LPXTG-site transpeptidase (sortase) family protein
MLVQSRKNYKKKLLNKIILIPVVVLVLFIITIFLNKPVFSNFVPLSNRTITVKKQADKSTGLPTYLKIPSINVSAAIYYVGLTSDGSMDIKMGDLSRVAWYQLGPRPGEIGSAVIAGHYGWIGTQGSVFNDLHNLKTGDSVLVTDANGATIKFIVRETKMYDLSANTHDIFISNDRKAHLNLITCYGTWLKSKKTYSNRLVVFTDKTS